MGKVINKPKKSTKPKDNNVVSAQLKKQLTVKKTVKRLNKTKPERGIVLVKSLPKEFREPELKSYFAQFGKVTRVKLARSERTGNSKRYAYIEFEVPEVAEIAAASMHNYLMFKKLVKSVYIPPAEQKSNYFRTTVRLVESNGKIIPVSKTTKRINESVKKNNSWTIDDYQKRTNKSLEKLDKLKAKYADLGIDLDNIVVKPAADVLEKCLKSKQKLSKGNNKKPKNQSSVTKSEKKQIGNSKKNKLIKKKLDFIDEQTEESSVKDSEKKLTSYSKKNKSIKKKLNLKNEQTEESSVKDSEKKLTPYSKKNKSIKKKLNLKNEQTEEKTEVINKKLKTKSDEKIKEKQNKKLAGKKEFKINNKKKLKAN